MNRLLQNISMAFLFALLTSCGAGKKLETANAQIASLTSQVEGLQNKAIESEKQMSQLKIENIQYGKEAEDCRKAKEAVAKRFENLNNALAEKGTSMKQIRENAADELKVFQDQGATVTYKHGLVHINFADKFFFRSGTAAIAAYGRKSLNTVASVLRENPGVTCIIVGYTDSEERIGRSDNWSLSTERANAVVRILHDTYNINPTRLTAAGKGAFSPVASNATPEGREKNRRIEIIFNPDLSRLWELSEK